MLCIARLLHILGFNREFPISLYSKTHAQSRLDYFDNSDVKKTFTKHMKALGRLAPDVAPGEKGVSKEIVTVSDDGAASEDK